MGGSGGGESAWCRVPVVEKIIGGFLEMEEWQRGRLWRRDVVHLSELVGPAGVGNREREGTTDTVKSRGQRPVVEIIIGGSGAQRLEPRKFRPPKEEGRTVCVTQHNARVLESGWGKWGGKDGK